MPVPPPRSSPMPGLRPVRGRTRFLQPQPDLGCLELPRGSSVFAPVAAPRFLQSCKKHGLASQMSFPRRLSFTGASIAGQNPDADIAGAHPLRIAKAGAGKTGSDSRHIWDPEWWHAALRSSSASLAERCDGTPGLSPQTGDPHLHRG